MVTQTRLAPRRLPSKDFTRTVGKTITLPERYRVQPIVQEKVNGVAKGNALHCHAATRRCGVGFVRLATAANGNERAPVKAMVSMGIVSVFH